MRFLDILGSIFGAVAGAIASAFFEGLTRKRRDREMREAGWNEHQRDQAIEAMNHAKQRQAIDRRVRDAADAERKRMREKWTRSNR